MPMTKSGSADSTTAPRRNAPSSGPRTTAVTVPSRNESGSAMSATRNTSVNEFTMRPEISELTGPLSRPATYRSCL